MLLVKLKPEQVEILMEVARDTENPEISIDLENQKVFAPNGIAFDFDIDPFLKQCLLEGLDEIGLTMQKDDQIETFESEQSAQQPWLYRKAS